MATHTSSAGQAGPNQLTFTESGRRYTLGGGADFFGVWDQKNPGPPIARFPGTEEGRQGARLHYSTLEKALEGSCPSCGSESSDAFAQFCGRCGAAMSKAGSASPTAADMTGGWSATGRPSSKARATAIRRSVGRVFLLVLLGGLVAGYLIVHNLQYSQCLVQPGLFSWPSVCI